MTVESAFRSKAAYIFTSKFFDMGVLITVVLNTIMLAFIDFSGRIDKKVESETLQNTIRYCEIVFTIIYAVGKKINYKTLFIY